MSNEPREQFALGIDLGSASVGWALIKLNSRDGEPDALLDVGVRIFEPGVAASGKSSAEDALKQGSEKSKAVDRRTARLQRRQLRRRSGRQRELYKLLQKIGLLPPPLADEPDLSLNRQRVLDQLDAGIRAKWESRNGGADKQKVHQLLPYVLRKAALDEKLEPHELGRVFYHLSQRRGFQSNRRETKSKDAKKDDASVVKKSISELGQQMETAGARTLGEYFAGLDPHERRIRVRWTGRKMYADEFDKIWAAQQPHHSAVLTPELKEKISHLLYFQRPLMDQSGRIGECELIPTEKRAPWASWEAQWFRIIQKVNDTQIITREGELRRLAPDERQAIIAKLENDGDQTFAALRKLPAFSGVVKFNLEAGGEKKLRGNRVTAAMRKAFGARWDEFPLERRRQIIRKWRDTESPEKLAAWLVRENLFDAEGARKWAGSDEWQPEDGYCKLSEAAIRKLLPEMEQGISYQTAAHKLFPDRFAAKEALPLVPIVRNAVPTLRNPAVERALTELRKVVNAVIRKYGKPYEIRIELARDLKNPRWRRKQMSDDMQERRDQRKTAEEMIKECGTPKPSRDDVDKALLHVECGGICPYTGKHIDFKSLFGENPEFHVEHILPQSRFPGNSFNNRTLCHNSENARKGNRTPWEAYHSDPERYDEIIRRVKNFRTIREALKKKKNEAPTSKRKTDYRSPKLWRFLISKPEELEEFTNRQLNDTSYSSKLAARLLGTLYGGREVEREKGGGWEQEEAGRKRRVIHSSSGMVTATLRKAWCLDSILAEPEPSANGKNKGKARTDHRHHAIDAIVIALTTDAAIKAMNRVASNAPSWINGPRKYCGLEGLWPNFVESIRPRIEQMVVSHRPEHKLSGELHKETLYGKPRTGEDGKSFVHQRRKVQDLKAENIREDDYIADKAVREAVQKRLDEVGGNPKAFEKEENLPFLTARDGRHIPIRKVRVRETCNTTPIGKGPRLRFIQPANIHHVELFVRRDGRRQEYWDSEVVSLLDAMGRKRDKKPVVARKHPKDTDAEFLFSLMKDDTVELKFNGERRIFRVKKFDSMHHLCFVPVNNAQMDVEQKAARSVLNKLPEPFRKLAPRKVVVDLLGQVHPAND